MRSNRSILSLVLISLVLASCAGPEKLARQSREELASGHGQRAYERARKALNKDPSYGPAIEAMAAAGARLIQQHQDRVLALAAAGDTLGACDACLRMDAFRLQLADYSVNLPPDPGFGRVERRIRVGGAEIHYRYGKQEESAGRPRRAYDEYIAANTIVSGYRDVEDRIRTTGEAAIVVVAILPWSNQTDVPGLSMEVTDHIYQEVGRRITPRDFRFTMLMGRNEVYDQIPLSALDALSRDQAVQIGRELGADLVVVGRVFGLRSQNNTIDYTQTVYRPRKDVSTAQGKSGVTASDEGKGTQGQGQGGSRRTDPTAGYVAEQVNIVRREMNVVIQFEFTVLDTETARGVTNRTESLPASVATVYSSFRPVGPRRDYRLYPPGLAKAEPETVKRIDRNWKDHVGDWALADFLDQAYSGDHNARYRQEDRARVYNYRGGHPVFLGALPPEDDLARVALDRVWVPILGALKDLDR